MHKDGWFQTRHDDSYIRNAAESVLFVGWAGPSARGWACRGIRPGGRQQQRLPACLPNCDDDDDDVQQLSHTYGSLLPCIDRPRSHLTGRSRQSPLQLHVFPRRGGGAECFVGEAVAAAHHPSGTPISTRRLPCVASCVGAQFSPQDSHTYHPTSTEAAGGAGTRRPPQRAQRRNALLVRTGHVTTEHTAAAAAAAAFL
jgi:hypothetical protein